MVGVLKVAALRLAILTSIVIGAFIFSTIVYIALYLFVIPVAA